MWVHLYDSNDNWVAQFVNADSCARWVAEQGLEINDYRLQLGPSKYPS
jgi:hypothetical protein